MRMRSHESGSAEPRPPGWVYGVMFAVATIGLGLGGYLYGPALVQKAKANVALSEPLPEIQERLRQAYPEETVAVHDHVLDGRRSLRVSLTNSQHADLDTEARRAVALGVARLALASAPDAHELALVSVRFVNSTDAGIVRWTDGSDEHRFTPGELSGGDEGVFR